MVKLVQGNYNDAMKQLKLSNYKKVENYETMLKYRNQTSLFGDTPVLVSTNSDLQKYDFENFSNNILVVLEKVDKRSKLYKVCKKNKSYYEFTYQEDISKIPPQYQAVLNTLDNVDVRNNVIRQLNLLDDITDKKFYAILGNVGDFNIFKTIDAFIDNRPITFLRGYATLVKQGEPPFKIMVMLRKRIEDMLILKSYENYDINRAQQLSGLNYYFIKNNVVRVKKLTKNTILTWYKKVVNTQYKIVSGEIEEGLAINNLLTDLFTPLQNT